jgi:hypothetical protein
MPCYVLPGYVRLVLYHMYGSTSEQTCIYTIYMHIYYIRYTVYRLLTSFDIYGVMAVQQPAAVGPAHATEHQCLLS